MMAAARHFAMTAKGEQRRSDIRHGEVHVAGPPPGINDGFSEEGLWWLPSNEEDKVAGTLTIDQQDGALLSLVGVLGNLEDTFNDRTSDRRTIHGVTKKGRPVTLLNTFRKSSQLNFPGLAVETHFANVAAIGLHFDGVDQDIFPESWVRFDGIERWLGHEPFEMVSNYETREITLNVRKSWIEQLAAFGGYAILSGSNLYTKKQGDTDYTVTVMSLLGVRSDVPRSLIWHLNAATRLQELASLCTGHYLPMLSFELRFPQNDIEQAKVPPLEVHVYARMHHPHAGERPIHEIPLISAPELLRLEPQSLERWFEHHETMSPAMNLFFTVTGERKMFVNIRFLLAIQALEVFHRRTSEARVIAKEDFEQLRDNLLVAIPLNTPGPMREKLDGLYRFANEPSLMQRLRSVLKGIETDFGECPAGFGGGFARSLVDTRNYNTHFSVELKERSLDGEGMWWATRRIILLLSVLFLMRLGLKAENIREILSRHNEFDQLWQRIGRPN